MLITMLKSMLKRINLRKNFIKFLNHGVLWLFDYCHMIAERVKNLKI